VNEYDCLYERKPDETVLCTNECLTPHWKTYLWQSVNVLFSLELFINGYFSVQQHVHRIEVFAIVELFVLIMDQSWMMTIAIDN
jgi:hypothetical protein